MIVIVGMGCKDGKGGQGPMGKGGPHQPKHPPLLHPRAAAAAQELRDEIAMLREDRLRTAQEHRDEIGQLRADQLRTWQEHRAAIDQLWANEKRLGRMLEWTLQALDRSLPLVTETATPDTATAAPAAPTPGTDADGKGLKKQRISW